MCTVVVDTHAVVERLFPELLFCIVEDCASKRGGGEGDAVDRLGFRRWEIFLVAEEGGDVARLGGPAVGFER